MSAKEWDGIGPKAECLLLVVWKDGQTEWMQFEWKDDDASGYNDGEGEYSVTHEGYYHDGACLSVTESGDGWMGYSGKFDDFQGGDFTITHWAELPAIPRVVDLAARRENRIRNDVEEGASSP